MTTATAGVPASPSIDPTRWPDLAVSRAKARSAVEVRVARQLFRAAASRLPVRVDLGGGTVIGGAAHDESAPLMVVHRADAFFAAVGAKGLIGFGESYMAGDWEAPDLAGLLEVFAAQMATLIPAPLQKLRAVYVAASPPDRAQHGREHPRQHRPSLRPVQRPVRDVPRPDAELLVGVVRGAVAEGPAVAGEAVEVTAPQAPPCGSASPRRSSARSTGCSTPRTSAKAPASSRSAPGGASCAIRAARRGARVTSVTLSSEQQALARARIAEAGFAAQVDVELLRLPPRDGSVRRRGLGRDDRGRRPRVLAGVLRDDRQGPGARWPGRDPGDHHAARPDARHPLHLHVDQQVHLPRRLPAVDAGDRGRQRRPHVAAGHRAAVVRAALRRDAAAVGRAVPRLARASARSSASTRCSRACGTSTSSTPEPGSGRATSTCSRSSSNGRRLDDDASAQERCS